MQTEQAIRDEISWMDKEIREVTELLEDNRKYRRWDGVRSLEARLEAIYEKRRFALWVLGEWKLGDKC